MFKAERVIYPSSEEIEEILVVGKVDGKTRNRTVRDASLGNKFVAAIQTRDAALKAAAEEFEATFVNLSNAAMQAAEDEAVEEETAAKEAEKNNKKEEE